MRKGSRTGWRNSRKRTMKHKAVALISGGLDSLLAAKIMMEQNIDVIGVAFVMSAASRDPEIFTKRIKESAKDIGVSVKIIDISKKFLLVLKDPHYGYGANINPCIDCKILMLKEAKRVMEEKKADFVITGEVLGERPMSQRKDALNIIKKKSSLGGHLLRPLSAKLLDVTEPEKKGIVKREKLLAIEGRSRKKQLALAKKYGINKYFTPAGGCLLTYPSFAKKVKDLIKRDELSEDNITLLKYGRHFRLDDSTRVIIGRDEEDNKKIVSLKKKKDIILRLKDEAGPYGLLRGKTTKENIGKAAELVISHSKAKKQPEIKVEFWKNSKKKELMEAKPIGREKIDKIRVS